MSAALRLRLLILAIVILSRFVQTAHAEGATYSEASVKAAFVYNFFKFIELSGAPSKDVRLCVFASPEKREALRAVDGKALEAGLLRVRELRAQAPEEDCASCDAIFVEASDKKGSLEILSLATRRKILTIGEGPAFIQAGGAIRLYIDQGKIRFEVNLGQAEAAGAKISSKLLKLGRVVNPNENVGSP
ncbi:MAG: YfiR family protein [Deltaproteobacteria bacterium]|nr:YfiR family protein [Deltaproteobacteria bacterium]